MGMGTSTFVIRWINFLTMLLAISVVVFEVWMSTHHDGCRKSLTIPVLAIGAVIFLVSIIGFLGALKRSSILLWIYLILLCFILVGILVFTVLVSVKEAAYHAWLGYYNSIRETGRDKTTLVEHANLFCQSIGLQNPPSPFRKTALKMGLKDMPGIKIRK